MDVFGCNQYHMMREYYRKICCVRELLHIKRVAINSVHRKGFTFGLQLARIILGRNVLLSLHLIVWLDSLQIVYTYFDLLLFKASHEALCHNIFCTTTHM